MLKKYSFIDILFFTLCAIFIGISLYELVYFIIPRYTYTRAIISFFVLMWAYVGYNFMMQSSISSQHEGLQSNTKNDISVLDNNRNTPFYIIQICIEKIYSILKKYRDQVVYVSFICIAIGVMLSQIFDITIVFTYGVWLFLVIFIIAKFLWFSSNIHIIKSKIHSFNTLRFFFILFAIFFVVINYASDAFLVPEDDRLKIYIIASLIYCISGVILFFDVSRLSSWFSYFIFQRFLRPYSVAMTILIVWLGWYLIMKNNLVSQIWQWVEQFNQSDKIENQGIILPSIVSNEAVITNWDENSQDIEYESILVSSRYEIQPGLAVWSEGESVVFLQTVLWNLQYFLWDVDGEFNEETRIALVDALRSECDWPDTTRGIFWPQAKECIDNLEISIVNTPDWENQDLEDETEIIPSNEI